MGLNRVHNIRKTVFSLWLEIPRYVKSAVSSRFLAKFVHMFLMKRLKCIEAIDINKQTKNHACIVAWKMF